MADINIRPFLPSDQACAKNLILAGLAEHFSTLNPEFNVDLNDISKYYIQSGHVFLIAELGGKLVGTGALVTEAEGVGRIVRVSVDSSHRRHGIGKRITDELLKAAQRIGYCQVVVETNDDWYDAIRLYQRSGFREYDHSNGERHFMLRL